MLLKSIDIYLETVYNSKKGIYMSKPKLPPEAMPEQLLSLKEVGRILRYNRDTVMRLIKTGELKGRRVGWGWRVKKSDLEAFIEGNDKEGKDG